MASYNWPPEAGGAGVSTLNGLSGNLTLVAGSNITITPSGSNITIAATDSDVNIIGTIDSNGASLNGASIAGNSIFMQSASATDPGLVNLTTQSFAGNKTFTGTIGASNLSGTNTGDVTLVSANGLSLTLQALSLGLASTSTTGALSSTDWNTFNGKQATLSLTNLTDAGTDGITITNGTGAVIGASPVTISQRVADTTHNGYLSSTDWNTFNGKQAAGTYVTSVSVASSNGLAGSSSGGATPTLTLSTSITGILQGNGTAISAASTTGTGNIVLATNASLTTPALDTPSAITLTNATGLPLTTGVTGTLGATNGGTGTATYTTGDTLYASATNTLSKLSIGSTGQVLKVVAGVPAWSSTAGAGTAPTFQKFNAQGSGTYTTPAGVLYLKVTMVGGGGGASGSSTDAAHDAASGVDGGNSTFGTSLLTANGGKKGTGLGAQRGGAGGTASIGAGATGTLLSGGSGQSGGQVANAGSSTVYPQGGSGGNNALGGGGGGEAGGTFSGQAGAANTGGGGGGASVSAGTSGCDSGAGGGAGGYVCAFITSSISSTYAYTVGAAGSGGTGGTGGGAGGQGGSGYIFVEEFYE